MIRKNKIEKSGIGKKKVQAENDELREKYGNPHKPVEGVKLL